MEDTLRKMRLVETFNGSLRDECPYRRCLRKDRSLAKRIQRESAYQALLEQTPVEFARKAKTLEPQLDPRPAGN